MTMHLTQQDVESITTVNQAMSAGFIMAGATILKPLCDDPRISPLGLMLGVVQSHVDGLASALSSLEPDTRDQLIDAVPQQLRTIIARGQG